MRVRQGEEGYAKSLLGVRLDEGLFPLVNTRVCQIGDACSPRRRFALPWQRFSFALANPNACQNLPGIHLSEEVFASANSRVGSLKIALPTKFLNLTFVPKNYIIFIEHQIESMSPFFFF